MEGNEPNNDLTDSNNNNLSFGIMDAENDNIFSHITNVNNNQLTSLEVVNDYFLDYDNNTNNSTTIINNYSTNNIGIQNLNSTTNNENSIQQMEEEEYNNDIIIINNYFTPNNENIENTNTENNNQQLLLLEQQQEESEDDFIILEEEEEENNTINDFIIYKTRSKNYKVIASSSSFNNNDNFKKEEYLLTCLFNKEEDISIKGILNNKLIEFSNIKYSIDYFSNDENPLLYIFVNDSLQNTLQNDLQNNLQNNKFFKLGKPNLEYLEFFQEIQFKINIVYFIIKELKKKSTISYFEMITNLKKLKLNITKKKRKRFTKTINENSILENANFILENFRNLKLFLNSNFILKLNELFIRCFLNFENESELAENSDLENFKQKKLIKKITNYKQNKMDKNYSSDSENIENSDNISIFENSSEQSENNFIKIGENDENEQEWKFLDNDTIFRKKDNLTITVGDCIYLENEEIIKNKNCYNIYLITSIYRNSLQNSLNSNEEEEIFLKTIPLKRQYDLFPFRNDDLELFLFIDNEECINLENVNIVKKCCVFFLPNLNYFYKIKNIYFLRDIYFCTKIVKLNENNKLIFRNLEESEWTNKEQLYNYCKLLQPQYFTTTNHFINHNLINNNSINGDLINNNSINSNNNNEDKNKIIGLDLFCGCGGLSYGLEKTELIKIKYSIDLNRNALKTYKYNMNHCNVFLKDASFFLRKIKLIDKLYELVQDNNSKNGNLNDSEEVVMGDTESDECENFCNEKFHEMERNNLFLEKILKIKFDNLKNLKNLKFKILNKNKTNLDKEYVNIRKLKQFKNYKQVLLEYLNTKYGNYPKRGEIDLICGGPPCQGNFFLFF